MYTCVCILENACNLATFVRIALHMSDLKTHMCVHNYEHSFS